MTDYIIDDDRADRSVQAREEEMAKAREDSEHYWMAMLGYAVKPPFEEVILDVENLRTVLHIACMICGANKSEEGTRCQPDQ